MGGLTSTRPLLIHTFESKALVIVCAFNELRKSEHQENSSRVVGLVRLMCLTVVVSELLPFHFFVTNFKESEFSQFFISITHFQN